jgi:hypothetical protein
MHADFENQSWIIWSRRLYRQSKLKYRHLERSFRPRKAVFAMKDTSPSYRCKVSSGNSRALLKLGWKTYPVQVFEMSRDSFSVRVPVPIANRVSIGSKPKLLYQEMLWQVLCTQKWVSEDKLVDLEFQQVAELTPPKLVSQPVGGAARQVQAIPRDSTLTVASGVALILMVLIMPAWGGQWGTSDAICNAVQTVWDTLGQMVGLKRSN